MAGEFILHNSAGSWKLPVPDHDGVQVVQRRIGSIQTSLNGTNSLQTYGFKKEWLLSWTGLTEDEFAILDVLHQRGGVAPLVLHDPMHRNMMRAEPAASLRDGYLGGLVPQNGTSTLGESSVSGFPMKHTKLLVSNTGAESRLLSGDPTDKTLIPPRGETVTLSAWVKQTGGTAGTLKSWFHNTTAGGWVVGPVSSAWSLGEWTRVTLTAPVPEYSEGLMFGVALPANAGATEFLSTGWQVELGETATAWVPGHGTPKVHLVDLEPSAPRWGLLSASARLVEV